MLRTSYVSDSAIPGSSEADSSGLGSYSDRIQNDSNHIPRLDRIHKTAHSDRAANDFIEFGFRQFFQSFRGFVELFQQHQHGLELIEVRRSACRVN